MTPFPYQIEGAGFLASKRGALLADDMGLGKTVQAILAARMVGARKVLVACPASLTANWAKEFDMWWPDRGDTQVVVMSYDKLARRGDPWDSFDVLICDEAHYLKNPKTNRTRSVFGRKGAVHRAQRTWCLTGTPAPNNPSEMWPMLHALAPETITNSAGRPMDHWAFTRRYCVLKNNGFGDQIVGGRSLEQLRKRVAPFLLRRKKQDVLGDLPPIRFGTLSLEAKTAAEYARHMGDKNDEIKRLHAALDTGGVEALKKMAQEMASLRRVTALMKAPALAEWAANWLDTSDEKLVLFGVHRDPLDLLDEGLRKYHPAVIHGGVAAGKRTDAVERFQNDPDCRVFIGQVHAAGTGLTLTSASTLVFLEQSWTPADNVQAAMRIHRIGQDSACLVQTAVLTGSIDESVQTTLARKTKDLVELGFMEATQ